jgi:adenylate cyclase
VIPLASIRPCFEGEIPALIATASASGEPNVAHLSQVLLVDDDHVATTNQFFTKTSANLAENPLACLLLLHPTTLDTFKLLVRLERSETEGPLFESVRSSLEAIAALTGMSHVFALRAIDVFRVLDAAPVPARAVPGP